MKTILVTCLSGHFWEPFKNIPENRWKRLVHTKIFMLRKSTLACLFFLKIAKKEGKMRKLVEAHAFQKILTVRTCFLEHQNDFSRPVLLSSRIEGNE